MKARSILDTLGERHDDRVAMALLLAGEIEPDGLPTDERWAPPEQRVLTLRRAAELYPEAIDDALRLARRRLEEGPTVLRREGLPDFSWARAVVVLSRAVEATS